MNKNFLLAKKIFVVLDFMVVVYHLATAAAPRPALAAAYVYGCAGGREHQYRTVLRFGFRSKFLLSYLAPCSNL